MNLQVGARKLEGCYTEISSKPPDLKVFCALLSFLLIQIVLNVYLERAFFL